jgi:hypothetical protein
MAISGEHGVTLERLYAVASKGSKWSPIPWVLDIAKKLILMSDI